MGGLGKYVLQGARRINVSLGLVHIERKNDKLHTAITKYNATLQSLCLTHRRIPGFKHPIQPLNQGDDLP